MHLIILSGNLFLKIQKQKLGKEFQILPTPQPLLYILFMVCIYMCVCVCVCVCVCIYVYVLSQKKFFLPVTSTFPLEVLHYLQYFWLVCFFACFDLLYCLKDN